MYICMYCLVDHDPDVWSGRVPVEPASEPQHPVPRTTGTVGPTNVRQGKPKEKHDWEGYSLL